MNENGALYIIERLPFSSMSKKQSEKMGEMRRIDRIIKRVLIFSLDLDVTIYDS